MPQRKTRYIEKGDVGTGRFARVAASVLTDLDVCGLDPTQEGRPARAVIIATAGALVIQSPGDKNNAGTEQSVTIPALPTGYQLNVAISRVVASGTAATNLIFLW